MKKLTLLSLFFIFHVSVFTLKASTIINGPTASGHWTLAGSPYLIQNSVYIPNDSTLTIDPGVTVNFQTTFTPYIHVLGRLIAVGTTADTIYFTATDTTDGSHGIRFYGIAATNDTSKLEYCKIQYGKANGSNYYVQNGGALLFDNWSKAIVSHCYISNCQANFYPNYGGGAILCDSGASPVITYNTITVNQVTSTGGGGGIAIIHGSMPVVEYNTIAGNAANYGGAIYILSVQNYAITHNTIQYNSGFNGGGAIFMSSSKGTIAYNTISNNYVGYGPGGGIYDANGDTLSILNNTVSYNSCAQGNSGDGGGGINIQSTNWATIADNIIADNSALSSNGGGIYLEQAVSVTISNNSIINNYAQNISGTGLGGGIYCNNTSPLIINTTIANNYAYEGGGLFCDLSSNPVSSSCIYWGDTATFSGNELFQNDQPSTPDFYYCDVHGGTAAFGLNGNFYYGIYANNINLNPNFVSPSAGPGTGYNGFLAIWNLQNASPCIDSGDPLYTAPPATDLANNPRIVVCRVDMGAYENQYGISAPLQLTVTPAARAICFGDSTMLLAGGATSFSWSPSAGLRYTNIANPMASPAVTTTYTVIGTSGICEAMDTITLFVKPLPTVTFTGDDTTCFGIPVIITASGGGTYIWSNTSSSTTSSITVNPAASTTYSVAVTNNGCTKDTAFALTVNPLPSLTISNNVDTFKIKGAKTYLWSTGSTNDTAVIHQSGTYYVTATDSNGCIANDSIVVVFTSLATLNYSAGIAVYPVPSNGNMTVMLEGNGYVSLKITDELGREIYSQPIDADKQNQNVLINIAGVSGGVYVMQVISKSGVSSKRLVIQK